jgi:tetratricopeptide (TPR) repeat protein
MSLSESKRVPISMASSDGAPPADVLVPTESQDPYQRTGFLLRLRGFLLICRGVMLFYLGNTAWNLYGLLLWYLDPSKKPPSLGDLRDVLFLPRPLFGAPAWVAVLSAAAFVLLSVGALLATVDLARETRRGPIVVLHPLTLPPPEPNPPFDLALLPMPDHLIGREAELAWVSDHLRPGGASAVAALVGPGGIGKTGLAATVIRQFHDEGRFKDGIVVVNCNGKGKRKDDAPSLLRDVLRHLDPLGRVMKSATAADSADGLVQASRDLISGKEVLVVLDNVEPELPIKTVMQPLHAAGATLLLTARHTLPPDVVPKSATCRLDLLSSDDALRVFIEAYGKGDVTDLNAEEQAAAQRIVARLDRHTLAVRLAGAHAAATTADLGRLARDLEDDPFRIPRDDEERAVELVIKQSTDQLSGPAKQLFVALAAFATPELSRNAAQALGMTLKAVDSGRGQVDPGFTLDLLVKRALVDASIDRDMPVQTDRERLRMHLLVRALARQWFDKWPKSARRAAQRTIACYYATYCSQPIEPRWLARDQFNIAGALEWAHESGEQRLVEQLCLGLGAFWLRHGLISEALASLPWGIEAAHSLAKRARRRDRPQHRLTAATLSHFYGEALLKTGNLDEAAKRFEGNRRIFEELGDRRGLGKTLYALGVIAQQRGELDSAEMHYREAGNIHKAAEDREGEAEALMGLGQVAATRGRSEQAEGHFRAAIAIYRALGAREGEGQALGELGHIAREHGHLDDAERDFQQALQIARAMQNRREEAALLLALGQIAQFRQRLDVAEMNLEQALAIHREILERQGEVVDLVELGKVAKERGKFDEAEAYVKQALDIVPDRREQAMTIRVLGQIALARGDLDAAADYLREALQISRKVDYRRGQGIVLTVLGQVALARGLPDQAEDHFRESLRILSEVSDRIGYATAALALGTLLVSHRNQREEGCRLIQEAVTIRHELGLPDEQEARETARQLGCEM